MNTVDSLGFYDRSHNELKQHRQWRFSTEGRNYRKHTTDFKHEFSERCSTAFSVTLPKLMAEDKFSSRQVYHLWPITHFELSAISKAWFPYRCICRICRTKKIHRTDITLLRWLISAIQKLWFFSHFSDFFSDIFSDFFSDFFSNFFSDFFSDFLAGSGYCRRWQGLTGLHNSLMAETFVPYFRSLTSLKFHSHMRLLYCIFWSLTSLNFRSHKHVLERFSSFEGSE